MFNENASLSREELERIISKTAENETFSAVLDCHRESFADNIVRFVAKFTELIGEEDGAAIKVYLMRHKDAIAERIRDMISFDLGFLPGALHDIIIAEKARVDSDEVKIYHVPGSAGDD